MLDSDNATPGGLPVDAGSASPPGIVAATPVKPTKAISSTRLIKAARSRGVGPVGRARIASSTASARWISSPAASSAGTSARPSGTTRTAPSAPTAATDGVIRASTGTPAGSPSPRTCRVPRSMAASNSPATSQASGPSSKRDSPTIVTASTTSSRWFSRRGSIDPPFGSDGRRDGTRGERHFRAGWYPSRNDSCRDREDSCDDSRYPSRSLAGCLRLPGRPSEATEPGSTRERLRAS